MALRKRDKYEYGDSQSDIREYLRDYSEENYPVAHFADAVCTCGAKHFKLQLDDNEGAAVRICSECGAEHAIGDSEDYLEGAELQECECPCGSSVFEITAGVALYDQSEDVRWIYLGCRCIRCGLTACYGDWKNEYNGYEELLARV